MALERADPVARVALSEHRLAICEDKTRLVGRFKWLLVRLTFTGRDAVVVGDVGGVELGEGEEDDGPGVTGTRQRRLARRTAAGLFGRGRHGQIMSGRRENERFEVEE